MYRNKIFTLLPILITLIYMGVALSVFSRRYETNDNISILWNIKSDCLVYFMSVTLGKILSFCYLNISDIIPWYGLTLYVSLGLSIFFVIFSVQKLDGLGHLSIPILIMFLVLFLRHIIRIDYSAVSIMLASSSLLGLLIYLEKTDKKHFLPVIILGICFSFSYHIRISGIQAALCFTAPAILVGIFRVRKDYKYLLVFLIPLVITIPSDHFYRKSLETEADIRFREWNTLRAQFHGFPVERINRDNEKIRSVNNWSQNDYDLLSWWSYFDENKFNMDTLKNVFKYSLPLPTISEKVAFPLIKRDFIKLLKIHHIYLCVLVFIALLGFVTRGKRGSVMPVIYLGYVFGGVMWMLIFFRFPPRIGIPILLSCITWMTYIVFDNKKIRPESNNGGKKLTIFSGLLFMLFACAGIYCFGNFLKENSVKKEAYYRSVKELEEMKASFFLIEPIQGLNCQLADPLKSHNYNFKIIPSGWPIYSPRFYRVLREIGMEHAYEICPRLTSDEGCFVVGDELYVTRISKYLSQSYGLHHRLITVKQLSNHKTVYKLEAM